MSCLAEQQMRGFKGSSWEQWGYSNRLQPRVDLPQIKMGILCLTRRECADASDDRNAAGGLSDCETGKSS